MAVGVVGDARAVARVHRGERVVDGPEDVLDTLDEHPAVALGEVGPAETPAGEDQVAREEHPRFGGVETEVVVLVPGGVEGGVLVVAQSDGFAVGDGVVDELVVRIEAPDVGVERLDHAGGVPDVVRVGVGQHHGVEGVDVLADRGGGVEVVAGVDEDGALPGDEEGVAGENLTTGGEVGDHGEHRGGRLEPLSFSGEGSGEPASYHRVILDPQGFVVRGTRPDRVEMSDDQPVVLIVEDEPDVAETYRLWLESDYEVRMAHSGDEGLDELDESVDVVLLDRMMPGLSGDEVLARIRERGLGCRVAMVTAVEPDFDILEMGFDAYLCKPIKSEQLVDAVENLLERSDYDDLLQEYYSLVEKQATLEAAKSNTELADNEEYLATKERIEELQDDLSETLGGIESDEDFIATLRGLDDPEE